MTFECGLFVIVFATSSGNYVLFRIWLSLDTLIQAFSNCIIPDYSWFGPVGWWTFDPLNFGSCLPFNFEVFLLLGVLVLIETGRAGVPFYISVSLRFQFVLGICIRFFLWHL